MKLYEEERLTSLFANIIIYFILFNKKIHYIINLNIYHTFVLIFIVVLICYIIFVSPFI